ncbi:MAG: hypothetical protein M0R22_06315 [Dehalococcoidia bacterium]|jgi:hypothetical protein|nr:hypothetical protein [Dehalococcoidia bacterium]
MDSRIYVFALIPSLATKSWGFIALKNSVYEANVVPLETWNDRYTFCRVVYSHDAADEMVRSAGMSLMSGPDLYCIVDTAGASGPATVVTVWYPAHLGNKLEVTYLADKYTLLAEPTVDAIRACCFRLLGLAFDTAMITNTRNAGIREYAL